MSRNEINVGVIGVGYWGRKVVDEYSRIEGVTLRGVADLDERNLRFCEKYGVTHAYSDYARLLADDTVQGVSICVPNSLHYTIAMDALDSGKHVLVEKPMTLSSSESRELVRVAGKRGLTISVGHVFRFNNALRELRRLIQDANYFGSPFLLEMYWLNWERLFPDRDVIWDQAPHIFDIQNYLLDQWPVEVTCVAGAFRRRTGEETACILSRFESGTTAVAVMSWLVPRKTRQIFISGSARSALIDVVPQKITICEGDLVSRIPTDPNNTLRDELIQFIGCIREPRCRISNDGAAGVRTIELIEAAKKSIAESRAVSLA